MLVRALLRHLRKKAIQKVTDSDPHLPRADRSVAQKSPGSYQLVCAVIDDPNSKPLAEPKTCRGRFSRPMGSGLDFLPRARPARVQINVERIYATLRRRTCLMVHRACRLFRLARPVAATKVEDSAGRALSAFSVQPSTSERRR